MHKMNMIGQKRNVYQNSIAIKRIPMVKAMTIVTGNTVHAIPTPSVAIPSVVPLKYPPPTLVAVSDQNEKKVLLGQILLFTCPLQVRITVYKSYLHL